jgi:hypothetical protein
LTERDELLVQQFATLFEGREFEPDAGHYAPLRVETPAAALTELYAVLPARLPPLYERLILSCRWPDVELGGYGMLANPGGPGLVGLLEAMQYDPGIWAELVPRGLIPFGRGPGFNWDPVCFDTRRRRAASDCRVVQLDHEAILCYSRIREAAELAPTFRELMRQTVAALGR